MPGWVLLHHARDEGGVRGRLLLPCGIDRAPALPGRNLLRKDFVERAVRRGSNLPGGIDGGGALPGRVLLRHALGRVGV